MEVRIATVVLGEDCSVERTEGTRTVSVGEETALTKGSKQDFLIGTVTTAITPCGSLGEAGALPVKRPGREVGVWVPAPVLPLPLGCKEASLQSWPTVLPPGLRPGFSQLRAR